MPRHRLLTDACLDAALAPEDARAAQPVRFFHSAVAESLLRASPAAPYLLFGPLALALLALPYAAPSLGLTAATPTLGAVLVVVGALSWTLVEYALHRLIFHLAPTSDARRVARFLLHYHHHRTPSDPRRLVATPLQAGSLVALFFALDALVVDAWAPLLAGQLVGYLLYEWVHYSAHHRRPATRLGRALRRHHLRHHADGAGNYGISSPLWDWIFASARPSRDGAAGREQPRPQP
ncbi:MAG: sterol desaturase family protein [Nannocystaceae bacterium]